MLSLDNICSTHGLLNDYYKFFSRIQSTLLGFTNINNGEGPQVYCVSKKDGREEVEKKLPNERVVWVQCFQWTHWDGDMCPKMDTYHNLNKSSVTRHWT